MAHHTRVNTFQFEDSANLAIFLDYDHQNRVVGATVQVDDVETVWIKVTLLNPVSGVSTFISQFGQGTSQIAIPAAAGITVGFDASDGNAPFLGGNFGGMEFSTSPIVN